jgi:integrase/recombinase XerD
MREASETFSLYTRGRQRKYLNQVERRRALAASASLNRSEALFVCTLAWTGARVSEVLALCPISFQVSRGVVAIVTLKRRRHVVREVPVPPDLMADLDFHFALQSRQADPACAGMRLWPWCRVTAWRLIKRLMARAGVAGPQACPRGFRHGFGVGTLQAGVPLNLTQRWLGHARIETTAIYADACGPEEINLASRFWKGWQYQH